MSPSRAEYREYIESLEREAAADPRAYRRRVLLLVAQGYGYILGVLLLVLACLVLLVLAAIYLRHINYVVVKLGAPLLVLAWVIGRSLWVRVPEPEGWAVTDADAPHLFELIEDVRERLEGPALHSVLLTMDFNAGIQQIPAFGLLGGYRSYLLIGLPLMHSLTADEFRSVLAHEFGHLSRLHGKFGAWIYRLRLSWLILFAQIEREKGIGVGLFRGFIESYMPKFDATTFVLARQQEYEADRMAVEVSGARTAASALERIHIMDRWLTSRVKPDLFKRIATEAEPPAHMAKDELGGLRSGPDRPTATTWLTEALQCPTDLDDTHPSLTDRLRGMGVDPRDTNSLEPPGPPATETLLGAHFGRIVETLDKFWVDRNAETWKRDRAAGAESRSALEKMREQVLAGTLPAGEQEAYCGLLWRHEGEAAAFDAVTSFLAQRPEDHALKLMRGSLQLNQGDDSGLKSILEVVDAEPALAVDSCGRAYQWLFSRGRQAEADEWHERREQCAQVYAQGLNERRHITVDDEFMEHQLPDEVMRKIREGIAKVGGINAAWVVRKKLEILPGDPLWVTFVQPSHENLPRREGRRKKIYESMAKNVPAITPGVQVLLVSELFPLRAKLDRIVGARVLGKGPEKL